MSNLKPRDVLVYAVNGLGDVSNAQKAIDWFDGEQARQDAAVASAREEQARVDMDACNEALAHDSSWTPSLTATPLADRIAELERALADQNQPCDGMNCPPSRELEAERDLARAQVADATERLDEFGSQPTLADGIQAMRLRLVELRAQVEAARAWAASDRNGWRVLAAMDGAKP